MFTTQALAPLRGFFLSEGRYRNYLSSRPEPG
jgi:hypothetical protein